MAPLSTPLNTIIYNVLQNVEDPFSGEEGIIDERCITIDCAKRSCHAAAAVFETL